MRWDRPHLLTPDSSQLATCPTLGAIDDQHGRFLATCVQLADPESEQGVLQSVELTIP